MRPEESSEAKFDRLKKQLQDSILRDYPNPERNGCPEVAVLKRLATRPLDESVEGDPHWDHITHCSECYRDFLAFTTEYRNAAKARRARVGWGLGIAAVVAAIGVFFVFYQSSPFSKRPQNAELAYVKKTVDIPSMARSGSNDEAKPIVLDREPEELTVQLPIGSKAGAYELQLKKEDRIVLSAGANADIQNGTTAFTIKLDLSKLESGNYSIVVRQVPFDWNYYPVVVR